jgi:hypothetical protein
MGLTVEDVLPLSASVQVEIALRLVFISLGQHHRDPQLGNRWFHDGPVMHQLKRRHLGEIAKE